MGTTNKKNWLNLPNLLTILRILLVPTLLIVFLQSPADRQLPSLIVFLAAGLTDCLDGFFARRFNLITSLGKVLDPVADKLMCAAAVLCLSLSGAIPWFVLPVIVVKESYMAVGAAMCIRRGIEVASDIYGKIATALFYPAVLLTWPWHGVALLAQIGQALVYLSVVLSILAAVHYTLTSVKKSRELKAR